MELYPVRTRIVRANDDLVNVILESLSAHGLQLQDNDVLVLASKIVSYSQGRLAKLTDIRPSKKGRELADKYSLNAEFAELILKEADEICGGVEKAVLTLKNGILSANAGIDNKNSPPEYAVLWPAKPKEYAKAIRDKIYAKTGRCLAVMIVDSGLAPLRIGTIGLTLAVAGFKPIKDVRGRKDLYGKTITITRQNVADDLASAAHLLMGEAREKTPIVLVRDAPLDFDDNAYGSEDMRMPARDCIFTKMFSF